MQVQLPLAVVGQVVGALRSATVVPVLIWLPVQVPPDVIVVDIDPVAPALATATSASSTVMLPGDALDTVPRSVIPVGAVHATPLCPHGANAVVTRKVFATEVVTVGEIAPQGIVHAALGEIPDASMGLIVSAPE